MTAGESGLVPWYRCPRCKGELSQAGDGPRCGACATLYPVRLGIPDFRVRPDPYISIADDHDKGRRLAEHAPATDFAGLVGHYWRLTPDTPPDMARRFTAHAVSGAARGRHLLDALQAAPSPSSPAAPRRALEVGCRAGGVLVAMAERFDEVAGIDIALRWLVVARHGLAEHGATAPLAAACAEALPFPDAWFDLVVAENVLEHTHDPAGLIAEAHRVLRPGGILLATTWNRFALAPEPHVRVWGVGILPRRLARRYVKWRRGVDYQHVRLLSWFELRRTLRVAPWGRVLVAPGTPSFAEAASLPRWARAAGRLHDAARRWPIVRQALLLIGPWLWAICTRTDVVKAE